MGVEGSRKKASIRPYQAASICPHSGRVLQRIEGRKGAIQPQQGHANLAVKFSKEQGLFLAIFAVNSRLYRRPYNYSKEC